MDSEVLTEPDATDIEVLVFTPWVSGVAFGNCAAMAQPVNAIRHAMTTSTPMKLVVFIIFSYMVC
jgi:hypothetical protein